MPHVSLKVRLNGNPLPGKLNLLRKSDHEDCIYPLGTSGATLKLRNYDVGGADLVLERTSDKDGFRRTLITVAEWRNGPRDVGPHQIVGEPSFSLRKRRDLYSIKEEVDIRIYVDKLPDGSSYLEFQMDEGRLSSEQIAKKLKNLALSLGFEEKDIETDSYQAMYLRGIFHEASLFVDSYSSLPQSVLEVLRHSPRFERNAAPILFQEGALGTEAFLITKGRAFVPKDNVSLVSGQLVGEFATYQGGKRSRDVEISPDFAAIRVSADLLNPLMTTIPANAEKYLNWRLCQS